MAPVEVALEVVALEVVVVEKLEVPLVAAEEAVTPAVAEVEVAHQVGAQNEVVAAHQVAAPNEEVAHREAEVPKVLVEILAVQMALLPV